MSDPRLCIVGAGALSSRRIYPYIGAAGAQLVGVCDLDADKAATNARRFGGKAYQDVHQMLERERPDGVIICIGPEAHAQLAMAVMRAGYPVYTEKPPAPTAAAALEVARVARQTGMLCMTAFKKRYSSAFARAKQWINQFPASELQSISIDYASAPYSNAEGNLRQQFLIDFGIHHIDLVGYLFGDVTEVCSYTKDRHAYAIALRFANGAVGTMTLSDGRSFTIPTEEVELTASGGNFMTVHNSSTWRITSAGKPSEWREPPTFTSSGDSGNDTGHLAEISAFLSAIREKRNTTESSIHSSVKTMVLYEAIVESSATGRPTLVKYPAELANT